MIKILLTLLFLSVTSAMLMSLLGDFRRGSGLRGHAIPFFLGTATATVTIALLFLSVVAGFSWPLFISAVILTAATVLILVRRLKGKAGSYSSSDRRGGRRVGHASVELGRIIKPTLGKIGAFGLAIPVVAFVLVYCGEEYRISRVYISPEKSEPWKEGLTAKVYWGEEPSEQAKAGFEMTAALLGVAFRYVEEENEANLRIWPDTKIKYLCKLGETAGFASPSPITGDRGLESGDIHICRWTLPSKVPPPSDHALMAHETAHLLAGVGHHTGEGLMVKGGGGFHWFTDEEIHCMLNRIRAFRGDAQQKAKMVEENKPTTSSKEHVTTSCELPGWDW